MTTHKLCILTALGLSLSGCGGTANPGAADPGNSAPPSKAIVINVVSGIQCTAGARGAGTLSLLDPS